MQIAEQVPMLVAFGAGLAGFLSPCVLPLAPVYLASLAGPEVLEKAVGRRRLITFLHSLSFVVGFSIVFSLWGAGVGLLGSALIDYSSVINKIVGGLLVVFGILMLASLKIPWLNYERRINLSAGTSTGYLRSFALGAVFPVAWIPCISWQLTGILAIAGSAGTVWRGTYLLAIYSLGFGLPFLAVGAAFDFVAPWLKRINRYSRLIHIISGLLLIVVGVLVLTNNLIWFSSLAG